MSRFPAAAAAILLAGAAAQSQQVCNPVVRAPVYVQPAPVAQQSYYPPDYPYPVQKVVANDIAVAPLIVTVPVDSKAVPVHAYGSPYYYSVADSYREKAYIREVIREELRAIAAGVAPQPTAPPTAPPVAPPQSPPAATAQEQPDATTPADVQQKVLAVYQGKGSCLNCHTGAAAKGAGGRPFKLVDDAGRLLAQSSDKRWKIYGMASVGAMPPSAANDASKAVEANLLSDLLRYAALKDR